MSRELRITQEQIDRFNVEQDIKASELKKRLRTAVRADFCIVDMEGMMPYVVSYHGTYDIAAFRRKADAETFIKTFPSIGRNEKPK